MNQRSRLELALEGPYEDDARRLTDARYVSAFLNDLRDHYDCPPGYEGPLVEWAKGHPAVGGSNKKSYLEKFKNYKCFTKSDLPDPVIFPLENALIDYVRDLFPSIFGDKRRELKHERLLGGLRNHSHRAEFDLQLMLFAQRQDPTIQTWDYEKTWWFDYLLPPESADLIDRLQFLRVCHHSNLKIVRERPLQPDLPANRSIFHPLHLHEHLAQFKERRVDGTLLPREEYEGDYPFIADN